MRAGLPEPELNQPVYAAGDRWLGRPDMRWVEHRVLLEYQGREFHDSDEQRAQDEVRFKRFSDDGWSIVEVWAEDVNTDTARETLVLGTAEKLGHPRSRLELSAIHPRFFSARMLELAEIRVRRLRAQELLTPLATNCSLDWEGVDGIRARLTDELLSRLGGGTTECSLDWEGVVVATGGNRSRRTRVR